MIVIGAIFYYFAFRNIGEEVPVTKTFRPTRKEKIVSALYLIGALIVLLVGAHFTVDSASALAQDLGVPLVLIGILIVGV